MSRTRALTLHQPYATAIAYGPKRIETRSWPAPPAAIGQRLLIHAAKRRPVEGDAWDLRRDMLGGLVCHLHEPYTEEQQAAHGRDQDGDLHGFPMPLGAIVCSATLAACVPMVDGATMVEEGTPPPHALVIADPGILWNDGTVTTLGVITPDREVDDVSDQRPWGDFASGRWAWLLGDIEPCDPIPASGYQRVWWHG